MPTTNGLENIASFIKKEAEKQNQDYFIDPEIQAALKLLEQFSYSEADDFTLTAGEINAYMG